MFCFLLCRLARQVLWGGMSGKDALDVFCKRQTEVIKAFLNECGVVDAQDVKCKGKCCKSWFRFNSGDANECRTFPKGPKMG